MRILRYLLFSMAQKRNVLEIKDLLLLKLPLATEVLLFGRLHTYKKEQISSIPITFSCNICIQNLFVYLFMCLYSFFLAPMEQSGSRKQLKLDGKRINCALLRLIVFGRRYCMFNLKLLPYDR